MREQSIYEAVEETLSGLRKLFGSEPIDVSRREAALATLADPNASVSARRMAKRVEKETRLRKRTSARGSNHYMRKKLYSSRANRRYDLINYEHRRWMRFCIQHSPCFLTEDELTAIYDLPQVKAMKRWEAVKRDVRLPWTLDNLLIRKRDPRVGVTSEVVVDCRKALREQR